MRFVLVIILNRNVQIHAMDKPHGIIRPPIGKLPEAVHRHHARVLQSACDFRLAYEPSAILAVIGMRRENFLERDFAVQLFVERDRHAT